MVKAKEGFTLIELMIVVFIISILAAVAIPSMGGQMNKAKDSKVISLLSTARSSANEFYIDNDTVRHPQKIQMLKMIYTDGYVDGDTDSSDNITTIQAAAGTVEKSGVISIGKGSFNGRSNIAEIYYNNQTGVVYIDGVNGNGYKDTKKRLWKSY